MTNIKLPSRNGLLLEIIDLWNTIQQKKLIEYLQLQSLKQLLYLFAIISKPCGCQFSFDWKEILGNHRRHDIWYTFFVGWHTETILVQMVVCKMQINFLSHNFSIEHNVFTWMKMKNQDILLKLFYMICRKCVFFPQCYLIFVNTWYDDIKMNDIYSLQNSIEFLTNSVVVVVVVI